MSRTNKRGRGGLPKLGLLSRSKRKKGKNERRLLLCHLLKEGGGGKETGRYFPSTYGPHLRFSREREEEKSKKKQKTPKV